ncbi:hypothetical protein ACFLU6_09365 [Acidobacteriota bacterium]
MGSYEDLFEQRYGPLRPVIRKVSVNGRSIALRLRANDRHPPVSGGAGTIVSLWAITSEPENDPAFCRDVRQDIVAAGPAPVAHKFRLADDEVEVNTAEDSCGSSDRDLDGPADIDAEIGDTLSFNRTFFSDARRDFLPRLENVLFGVVVEPPSTFP